MTSDDRRPAWKHDIDEETARYFAAGFVTMITHHWEMTGVDTSRDWIELHKKDTSPRRFPSSFLNTNGYWEFKPNWRELVVPTYRGEQAIKDLEAIDKWEEKHRKERAEYERLQRKFGATSSSSAGTR